MEVEGPVVNVPLLIYRERGGSVGASERERERAREKGNFFLEVARNVEKSVLVCGEEAREWWCCWGKE